MTNNNIFEETKNLLNDLNKDFKNIKMEELIKENETLKKMLIEEKESNITLLKYNKNNENQLVKQIEELKKQSKNINIDDENLRKNFNEINLRLAKRDTEYNKLNESIKDIREQHKDEIRNMDYEKEELINKINDEEYKIKFKKELKALIPCNKDKNKTTLKIIMNDMNRKFYEILSSDFDNTYSEYKHDLKYSKVNKNKIIEEFKPLIRRIDKAVNDINVKHFIIKDDIELRAYYWIMKNYDNFECLFTDWNMTSILYKKDYEDDEIKDTYYYVRLIMNEIRENECYEDLVNHNM